jgi:hypothetical protein
VLFAKELFGDPLEDDTHIPWTMKLFASHIGQHYPKNTNFLCGIPDSRYTSHFQLVNINKEVKEAEPGSLMIDSIPIGQMSIQAGVARQNLSTVAVTPSLYLTNSTFLSQQIREVINEMGIATKKSQPMYTKIINNPDKIANAKCRASYSVPATRMLFRGMVDNFQRRTETTIMSATEIRNYEKALINADIDKAAYEAVESQGHHGKSYPALLGPTPAELARMKTVSTDSTAGLANLYAANRYFLEIPVNTNK